MKVNERIQVLDTRSRRMHLAHIESAARRGAEEYWQIHGFVNVSPPHLVPITGACENVDTLFDVNYFGQEAFLTQTGQTGLEMFTAALKKVCCEIRSFRKESSADARHLTEFPLLEIEFSYAKDEDGFAMLLRHIQGTVQSMMRNIRERAGRSLLALGADLDFVERMASESFRVMPYDDAVRLVGKEWGEDLNAEDEQKVVAHNGGMPTFVTKYPEAIKFFNMKRDVAYSNPESCNGNPRRVLSTDLLLPFSGEAVGAAVREEDYELLKERLASSPMFAVLSKRGKSLEDFKEYLDEVKSYPTPHAGCGIGLYRVLQSVLQTDDIRMAAPYVLNAATKLGFGDACQTQQEKLVEVMV